MNMLQDTLGFNMAFNQVWNHATAESLIARGFKVVEFDSSCEPGRPGDYAQDWYLVWQSDLSNIPTWYQGSGWDGYKGRQMLDGGDTVWVIGNQPGDTTRGWMCQTGGSHYKYKPHIPFGQTTRRVDFRLKATGVAPADTVAAIYCAKYWWRDGSGELVEDTVAADTIFGSEFTGGYRDFTISWLHQNPPAMWQDIWARYPVYWFGKGTLYFDEALSTDEQGSGVVRGDFDPNIDAYTTKFTYGTDGSYLLGWYLLDERTAPENAACWDHVNMQLRQGPGQKGGFQQFSWPLDAWSASKMLHLDYFMCIDYLAAGSHCNPDSTVDDSGAVSYSTDAPGGDSVSLQVAFDTATSRFRTYKHWADSAGLVFWPKIASVRYSAWCGSNCYESGRRATGRELLAHAGLALACGADALTYWCWGWGYCYIDGIYRGSPGYYDIRDIVSPFVDSLGDLFYDLKWLGSDSSQVAAAINGAFIQSVQSLSYPTRPYVEVAFFKDTVSGDDYFMLVNRRCLASESQQVRASLGLPSGMYYIVDKYSYDTVLTGTLPDNTVPFTTSLGPGQGKLFKIISAPASVAGGSLPATWQGGIRVGGNVTMAAGRTWTILPPARIRVDTGGSYAIDVYGKMIAEGTVSDSIRFVSTASTPPANNWYGIRVRGAGDVTMEFADVRSAYKGLWLWNTSDSITARIERCLFYSHALAGIAIDAHPKSAISVAHSSFGNWGYYGVQIREGKVDIDSNDFTGGGLNGVRIDGAYQYAVTGGHIRNNRFEGLTNPNATGVYIYGVRHDGLDWTTENLLQDNRFANWTGSDQVGVQVINCLDTLRFFRNAISGGLWKPGYGVLCYSTSIRMRGDLSSPESLSAITGTAYGLYCFNSSANDTDYATVRACSFSSYGPSPAYPGYDVWVSDLGKVNLGVIPDSGKNALYGVCSIAAMYRVWAVTNENTSRDAYACGNYWVGFQSIMMEGEESPQVPCIQGRVIYTPTLTSNPFGAGGAPKLAGARGDPGDSARTEFGHLANYPNPFNSSTVLKFSLADPGQVEVAVYNVLGQRVKTVCKEDRTAGEQGVVWDGRDQNGNPVASGVYFYTVTSGGKRLSKSIVLLK
jgi:hypothetical protein